MPIDQRNFGFAQIVRLDDARFAHLVVEVVAFARAFADACEDRYAAVELGNIVDQLHDDDRLAHSSAAESSHFAALQKWADQINHFDSGGEHLLRSRLVPRATAPNDGLDNTYPLSPRRVHPPDCR